MHKSCRKTACMLAQSDHIDEMRNHTQSQAVTPSTSQPVAGVHRDDNLTQNISGSYVPPKGRSASGASKKKEPVIAEPRIEPAVDTVDSLLIQAASLISTAMTRAGAKFIAARKLAGGFTAEYKAALARAGVGRSTERQAIQFAKDPQAHVKHNEKEKVRNKGRVRVPSTAAVKAHASLPDNYTFDPDAAVSDAVPVALPVDMRMMKDNFHEKGQHYAKADEVLDDLLARVRVFFDMSWPKFTKEQRTGLRDRLPQIRKALLALNMIHKALSKATS
jgi:hypothetical protein